MPANRDTGWECARLSAGKRTAEGDDSEQAMSEQLRAVDLPSLRSNRVERRVAGVAASLADRADELVDPLAEGTIREGPESGLAMVVPHDRRLRVHAANDPRSILAATKAERRGVPWMACDLARGSDHRSVRFAAPHRTLPRSISHTIAPHRSDVEQKVDET